MTDPILENAAEQVRAAVRGLPIVQAFFHEPTCSVSYVIHDPMTGEAAIIDSVLDYDCTSGRTSSSFAQLMIAYIKKQGLRVGTSPPRRICKQSSAARSRPAAI